MQIEKKIADLDVKLQEADQYKELTKDPNFFNNYDLMKRQLEDEMLQWEELSEKLQELS